MKQIVIVAVSLSMILGVGCAHKQIAPTSSPEVSSEGVATVKEVESFHVNDPEPNTPKVVDQELETIPVEMNERVEQWIRYFQGRGRPHMERYLARSTRYMGLMKRILRQNGLPEDLIYIALIESGFSSRATSRAAAVGYWQFIRGTGKRYGLEINSMVDERRDPVLATQAAAEYFKGLYSVFGSWYLAMASYNVGENRVKREVMNNYTRDFWELARKRRFPKETINYVPKFIAAKIIGNNPEKFGFTEIDYEKPIEFELIKVQHALNLKTMAEKMGLEYDDFKQLNPKFRGEIAPPKGNGALELRVPAGMRDVGLIAARDAMVEKVEFIADAGETQTYKVRSGDSLHTIARKYRTTVAWLRDTNDIKAGRKLRVGQRLQVPDRSSGPAKQTVVAKAKPAPQKVEDQDKAAPNPEIVKNGVVYYLVQPGDTLSAIADDYDSTVNELRKMNKLTKGQVLKAGMRLKVPKDDGLPSDPSAVASGGAGASKETPSVTGSSERHVVKAGENLTTIAKRYGVSIKALREVNELNNRSVLKVGASLVIPQVEGQSGLSNERGARRPASGSIKSNRGNAQARVVNSELKAKRIKSLKAKLSRIHVVRDGENLTQIASRYGVSVRGLKQKNQLGAGSKILIGSKLLIPIAEASEGSR